MHIFRAADLNRAIYYLQRNGLKSTWYAAWERLEERRQEPYVFRGATREELENQREEILAFAGEGRYDGIRFSIVVPTYRTAEVYLRELVDSLRAQTYPFWELILADATEDDSVWQIVQDYPGVVKAEEADTGNGFVRYLHLDGNAGISSNTNAGLKWADMEYTGLLDHDDVLTPDALFYMAEAIRQAKEEGVELQMLYSDEDKCDAEQSAYYEPNFKESFNPDLLLSNNYICHFLVLKTELLKGLGFRKKYDGAQDYDLVLRAATQLQVFDDSAGERFICHVPRVLYHWRCHAASTAENPKSKEYAYSAGRLALQDCANRQGWKAKAVSEEHVGFYRLLYGESGSPEELFGQRKDIGVIGFPVYEKNRLTAGRMDWDGAVFYEGLRRGYSGYLHRAVLTQNADAVDIRRMSVRLELRDLFEQVMGVPYRTKGAFWDASVLPRNSDFINLSLKWCKTVRGQGYRILYLPSDESG